MEMAPERQHHYMYYYDDLHTAQTGLLALPQSTAEYKALKYVITASLAFQLTHLLLPKMSLKSTPVCPRLCRPPPATP